MIMCEFKVLKKNEIVFKDAVYAKADGNEVTVRDVLGVSKVFENCAIAEVDVSKERLLLTPVNK
jgi:predicted RNA-binding protein